MKILFIVGVILGIGILAYSFLRPNLSSPDLDRLKKNGMYSTVLSGTPRDLEIFLKNGESADRILDNGETALATLIEATSDSDTDSLEKVKLLLKYGADPTQKCATGDNVIQLAEYKKLHRFIPILRSAAKNRSENY